VTGHKANGDPTSGDPAWSSLLEPPYSRELLADLHAGALEEELASALWPRVRAEQSAVAVLAGLDATVRQLRAAAEHPAAMPIPAGVAARIDAALAEQGAQPVAVTDLAAVRARRRRRGAYAGAALVAAAAAVAGAVSLNAVLGSNAVPGTPQAGGPRTVGGTATVEPGLGRPGTAGAGRAGPPRPRAAQRRGRVGWMPASQRLACRDDGAQGRAGAAQREAGHPAAAADRSCCGVQRAGGRAGVLSTECRHPEQGGDRRPLRPAANTRNKRPGTGVES